MSEIQYEAETGEKALYRKGSSDYHTLRYVKWLQARIAELEAENKELKLKHTVEICYACSKFREVPQIVSQMKALKAELDKAKEALEGKVVKCCETCDSFHPNKIHSFNSDGRCPFDSKGHRLDEGCENWNIEALESGGATK